MTAFDWIVLLIILCSIVISALRGLVKEILSLLSWVAAFVLANIYGAQMAALLPAFIPGSLLRMLAGFVMVLLSVLLLGALVNKAISALIEAAGWRIADRGLGGLFGLTRGVLIVLTLVVLGQMTALSEQPVWRDAALRPMLEVTLHTMKPWLPPVLATKISF